MITARRIVAAAVVVMALLGAISAQRKGEYLTDDELDYVRDVRQIDARTKVFLGVANRRLLAITEPDTEPKDKIAKRLGPMPTGTEVELLDDYGRAIDELMVKLDDEFERSGLTDELRAGLEYTVAETARQITVLEGLKTKLKEPEGERFRTKALAKVRELHDGASKALASQGK